MKKVVDFFPYFDPTGREILELRVNSLKDHVDEFLICESNKTQSGIPIEYELRKTIKECNLPEDKIKIIELKIPEDKDLDIQKIDKFNCYENNSVNSNSVMARTRERMQKDAILSVLDDYDNNTVFIHSDMDEIVKTEAITCICQMVKLNQQIIIKIPLVHLEGRADLRVHQKNSDNPKPWDGGMFFCTKAQLKRATPSQIRSNVYNPFQISCLTQDGNKIEDLGWHFSWMGPAEKRLKKCESFTHYDDSFSFLITEKYGNKNTKNFLKEMEVKEGQIPPSGDKNMVLRKYPVENLPKEIFNLPRVKEYLLPNS